MESAIQIAGVDVGSLKSDAEKVSSELLCFISSCSLTFDSNYMVHRVYKCCVCSGDSMFFLWLADWRCCGLFHLDRIQYILYETCTVEFLTTALSRKNSNT